MGFFDEISSKSSLNSKINKLNTSIRDNYSELGVRYYNLYKDNPDPKFAELINDITTAYAEIKEAEVQLAYLRGVVFCPNCHSECSADIRFCVKCGTQLVKPVQPQYVQPVVPQQPAAPVVPTQPVVQAQPVAPAQPKVQSEQAESAPTASPAEPAVPQVSKTAKAEFKFCTQCGNKVSAKAMFCTNCGKSFNN